jgi:hypothetical protein
MILASTLHHIKENTERREKKKKDQAGLENNYELRIWSSHFKADFYG